MSAVMTHTHCGWSSRSTGVCTGCHGTYAKIQIYDPSGSKINCGGQGCWLNSCSVCGGCSSHGCDTIGFNADKSDYQNRGGGSNWRAYGSGWESPMEVSARRIHNIILFGLSVGNCTTRVASWAGAGATRVVGAGGAGGRFDLPINRVSTFVSCRTAKKTPQSSPSLFQL